MNVFILVFLLFCRKESVDFLISIPASWNADVSRQTVALISAPRNGGVSRQAAVLIPAPWHADVSRQAVTSIPSPRTPTSPDKQ